MTCGYSVRLAAHSTAATTFEPVGDESASVIDPDVARRHCSPLQWRRDDLLLGRTALLARYVRAGTRATATTQLRNRFALTPLTVSVA